VEAAREGEGKGRGGKRRGQIPKYFGIEPPLAMTTYLRRWAEGS